MNAPAWPTLRLEGATTFGEVLARVKAHADKVLEVAVPIYEEDRRARQEAAEDLARRKDTAGYCANCGSLSGKGRGRFCYHCQRARTSERRRQLYRHKTAEASHRTRRPTFEHALAALDRLGCSTDMCRTVAEIWGLGSDDWERIAEEVATYRDNRAKP